MAKQYEQLHTAQEILNLRSGELALGRNSNETVALRTNIEWCLEFLCNPHPDLGRVGPVCPFVELSIKKGLLWLTLAHTASGDIEHVRRTVLRYKEIFLASDPIQGSDAIFKCILIVLPDVKSADAPDFVDGLQESLKAEFVECDLMLGEFHVKNNTPRLWNSRFRPLRAPVPMLVIRHMVSTDLPFLVNGQRYIRSYLNRFSREGRTRLRAYIQKYSEGLKQESYQVLLAELRRATGN